MEDTPRTQRARTAFRGRPGRLVWVWTLALLTFVSVVFIRPQKPLNAARPGAIRGRVELRRPAAPAERRPSVADLGTPVARDMPDLLRSVVPHVLAIMTGTTVDFPNSDKFYHNVFSLSKTRQFDLGRYAAGNSRPVRFDRAGIVRVFCDIHSHMNAYIIVFSHPFFAMTDAEGHYRIENVPPGTYGVIAWNEGTLSETRPITVPDGGIAEADFTVR